ncbi:MAG: hypothetical protein IKZ53_05540 [Selenomonadaceae bacterium]|nr:hypothetical protein [Selenomonadaceae bacterium]
MGGGGGCCVGDCCVMACCVGNCGFCCVFDSCSDSGCCVGNCGVSSSSSTPKEDHAIKTANELAEMTDRAEKNAAEEEKQIVDNVNKTMAEFIEWLKEVNRTKIGGKNLDINIDKIRELNEELRKKIVGFIGTRLKNRIHSSDSEVSTILAELDDTKRKKNFDDFYAARMHDAIQDLITEIEDSVREQSDAIEREIQNRIKELNNVMAQETRAFEDLKKLKEQEDSRLAEKQVEYMYYADLCDVMYNELATKNLGIGGR